MSASALTASVLTAAPALVASTPHVVNHLPFPAPVFGIIAFAVGMLLLLFVWMFRHSAAAAIHGERNEHGRHLRDDETYGDAQQGRRGHRGGSTAHGGSR